MLLKNKNNIKDIELADERDKFPTRSNWEKMKKIFSIKSFQECSTLT